MIRAGVGFSTAANPRIAAAQATASALAQAGISRATGALCFATSAYGAAYPMIVRAVASEAHTREVVGCSSVGVIAGETEIESGSALAVLVFGGNEDEIRATRFFVPTLRGRAAGVASDIATAVRAKLGKSNLLILLADTYNFEAEATLDALVNQLPGVTIAGGGHAMRRSNQAARDTVCQCQLEVSRQQHPGDGVRADRIAAENKRLAN